MAMIKRPQGTYRVLIVDDSPLESGEYRDALLANCKTQLELEVCNGLNSAIHLLNAQQDWDFVILDMMMPNDGSQIDRELTRDGKFSGAALAKEIRNKVGAVPIALLSNCTFKEVQEACLQTESIVENCIHWAKAAISPIELARKLDEYFIEGELVKERHSILKRIFGALLFQPNIGGVGVDIKKLVE